MNDAPVLEANDAQLPIFENKTATYHRGLTVIFLGICVHPHRHSYICNSPLVVLEAVCALTHTCSCPNVITNLFKTLDIDYFTRVSLC